MAYQTQKMSAHVKKHDIREICFESVVEATDSA